MSLKILLADDSLTAQNMGKKILTEAGYEVIAVSNGAQAMKKIASDQPDLVVLDVYMPGYTGIELCERIRNSRETARMPVVLSVGKMEAFKPEEVTRVRADGLIIKPFEATELVTMVKKLAEKVPPASVPRRASEAEGVPEMVESMAAQEPVPAEYAIQHHSFDIPQEIAATPAIGMELIPQEEPQPVEPQQTAGPQAESSVQLGVEREPAPIEIDEGLRMASAAGLSGVFEMEPTTHPGGEEAAEPTPVEEFERFSGPSADPAASQPAHEPAAGANAAPVDQDFRMQEPLGVGGGAECAPQAGPVTETWSVPPVPSGPTEYAQERVDDVQSEASLESALPHASTISSELSSWDEPVLSLSADRPHPSAAPVLDSSPVEFPGAGSVWAAEEAEVESYESAIPLHQQMRRDAQASGKLRSEPQANPAVSAKASAPSWEIPEPFPEPASELPPFREAAIRPESGPSLHAPVERSESQSAYSGPDHSSPDSPASGTQPAAEPAPAPKTGHHAVPASEFAPRVTVPAVTEAAVSPARIASIVEQVLERLKPEVVAAVTREIAKKDR